MIPFLSLKSISDKAHKLVDLNGTIIILPTSQILEFNKENCYISEWYLKNSTINYLKTESKYFNPSQGLLINESVEAPAILEASFHNYELVDKLIDECNNQSICDNLTTFLLQNFTFDQVEQVINRYTLTSTNYCWNNSTIFWQKDEINQVRGGKIMLYNSQTGKRIKKPYNHVNWVHKAIKEADFNLSQYLFGLHLINEDYQKDIAIVESEKTAMIMSVFIPDLLWVATGSKSNFKLALLEPLKKKNCFAFPDKGEFNTWNTTAKELQKKGFKISVSDILEQKEFENGFDLADYYFLL
jgi:hypothetical protein